MKRESYVIGNWRGQPDAMLPLDEKAWREIMQPSQREREADERKKQQTPNTTEPL